MITQIYKSQNLLFFILSFSPNHVLLLAFIVLNHSFLLICSPNTCMSLSYSLILFFSFLPCLSVAVILFSPYFISHTFLSTCSLSHSFILSVYEISLHYILYSGIVIMFTITSCFDVKTGGLLRESNRFEVEIVYHMFHSYSSYCFFINF